MSFWLQTCYHERYISSLKVNFIWSADQHLLHDLIELESSEPNTNSMSMCGIFPYISRSHEPRVHSWISGWLPLKKYPYHVISHYKCIGRLKDYLCMYVSVYIFIILGPILLTRIMFNHKMDKWLNPLQIVEWNYRSIPNLQWSHQWIFGNG